MKYDPSLLLTYQQAADLPECKGIIATDAHLLTMTYRGRGPRPCLYNSEVRLLAPSFLYWLQLHKEDMMRPRAKRQQRLVGFVEKFSTSDIGGGDTVGFLFDRVSGG